jgi:hypothetical protein
LRLLTLQRLEQRELLGIPSRSAPAARATQARRLELSDELSFRGNIFQDQEECFLLRFLVPSPDETARNVARRPLSPSEATEYGLEP